jgi:Ser/Thr protein kinase RdoA (MazF antagonist)
MITEPMLVLCLRRHWSLANVRIAVHNGGMGSATWFVNQDDNRWVAKAVAPAAGSQFAGGMAISQRLEQAGMPAGAPVPATNGRLVINVDDDWLALLTWVPGQPLTGQNRAEQNLIGTTLAKVHRALAGQTVEGAQRFHWVDPDAGHLSLRPWLRPAITSALATLDAADPGSMSWGLLHADPRPMRSG